MLLRINPDNPEGRKIQKVVECLELGGIIIYPTDTVYGLGCNIFDNKAVERICRLRNLDPVKARLSFICKDFQGLLSRGPKRLGRGVVEKKTVGIFFSSCKGFYGVG